MGSGDGPDGVAQERRRAVDRAVDRILTDLTAPLDLAALGSAVGYSPGHLQRVFTETMGESPAAFVARTRVERAVALARAEPARAWKDLAWEVGFASPAQLSRAFHRQFGRPARTWDRSSSLVGEDRRPGRSDAAASRADGPRVEVARVPALRFAYRRVRDPYEPGRLAAAWEEVERWRTALGEPAPVLGMSWDDPATVPLEQCRYDLGLELRPSSARPTGASERWMPSTVAAVVRVDGDLAAVDEAWEHLHRRWLPEARYRATALPAVERFHADPRPSWERWSLDCILPVAPGRDGRA